MNEVEIWRDIPEYEGLYQVSNMGRVKSLANDKGRKEKILKSSDDSYGYLQVNLYKNNKVKHYTIHRLVVTTFMGKSVNEQYSQVNHRDENKHNNNLNNLEYCTRYYNMTYGTCQERSAKSRLKPVIGINKINGYICEYSSATEVEHLLGIDQGNIVKCCQEKLKSAGGYIWMYKEENREVTNNGIK